MKFMIILPILFMSSHHPISMIIFMVITMITMNMLMYISLKHSWFIMIFILLILGGLLVVFLYITSLSPNKKFFINKKIIMLTPILMTPSIQFLKISNNHSQTHLFMTESMTMMTFTLLFLIITLMVITSIIKTNLAPIKMN
uniref:NADH dehydrogenase subunit 6 n=1 Tax=Alectorobius rudis TaxID=2058922 RepID=UPI002236F2D8|nr:NADH dehydrogenase subunit 6 [Alectorobius rudis]UYB78623.1 NADH dehydrogenase subunit 6 [Alectorobius rudis]